MGISDNNVKSRDEIFFLYKSFVEGIASKFFGLGVEKEELFSIAYVALLNFIENNISDGNIIINILEKRVFKALSLEVLSANGFIYAHERYLTMKDRISILRAKYELSTLLGRTPTYEEISVRTGLELYNIVRFFRKCEKEVYTDLDNMPYEVRNQVVNNVLDVQSEFIYEEMREYLSNIFATLTDEERKFVRFSYSDEDFSSVQIADKLQVNVRKLSFIESKILSKLKKFISYFEDFALYYDLSKRANLPNRKGKNVLFDFYSDLTCIKDKETLGDLFVRYRNGDIYARDLIFFRYIESAEEVAKDYFDLGVENEDIISYTQIVLLECILNHKDFKDAQLFAKDWRDFLEVRLNNYILDSLGIHNSNMNKETMINILKGKRHAVLDEVYMPDYGVSGKTNVLDTRILYDAANPEEKYIYEEIKNQMNARMEEFLSLRQMEAFWMLFFDEELIKNVAKKIGISQPGVSQMKSRILLLIRLNALEYFNELCLVKDSIENRRYSLSVRLK